LANFGAQLADVRSDGDRLNIIEPGARYTRTPLPFVDAEAAWIKIGLNPCRGRPFVLQDELATKSQNRNPSLTRTDEFLHRRE
jgi:hypothetical protein